MIHGARLPGAGRQLTDDYFARQHGAGARTIWRITRMALRYRWHFALAIAVTLIGASFFLWIPRLLGQGVDQAFTLIQEGSADPAAVRSLLLRTAIVIVIASALRGTFGFLQMFLGETLGQRVAAELRMRFFDKLQALSFSFHDNVHTGNLMSRGISDIEGVRMFVQQGLVRSVYVVVVVVASAALIVAIDWQLALVSLSFIPFVAYRSARLRLELRRYWLRVQELLGALSTTVQENLAGTRVVRAFAAQSYEERKFTREARNVQRLMLDALAIQAQGGSVMSFAFLVAWALILWLGGVRVVNGSMTVGELTQVLAFMAVMQFPVRMIPFIVNSVARAHSAGGRVLEVLDQTPAIADRPGAGPLAVGEGVVRFDSVAFSYGTVAALRNVTFEVRPDRAIGIVGAPGSGKSTIANLLPRFYDVTAGAITIDGVDIREVTVRSLRRAVGIVQQDPFLFDGTLRDNIAYGHPDATMEQIEAASRLAQVHDFIAGLPEGYQTEIGERGVGLSGGQRQRVALARTLLLDPPILIFDDSTSSVDAGTDQRIRQQLAAVAKGRTTITIAHRLSSLRQSDEILVMDAGEIVERGTHDGLMRRNGRYREIFELQRLQGSETTDAGAGGSLRPRAGGGEDVPGGGEEGQ